MPVDDDTGMVTPNAAATGRTDARTTLSLTAVAEAVLRVSSEPIFVVDRQSCILYVGEAGARLLGRPASEIVGKMMEELGFDPEAIARIAPVFHLKQPVSTTALILTAGSLRRYEHHASPILDNDGEVSAMLCVVRDLALPRADEEAARERERRVHTTLQSAQMGLFEIDLTTEAASLSEETKRLLGFPPEAQFSRREQIYQHLHPDDRPLIVDALTKSSQTGEPFLVEFRVNLPDGGVRWLAARGRTELNARGQWQRVIGVLWNISWRKETELALHQKEAEITSLNRSLKRFDEQGNPRGSVGAFIDITDRKRAEERLRQSEENFRILAEAMPQFVWMSDAEGKVEYVNRRWTEYTGQTVDQTGPHGDDVIHPEDALIMWDRWNQAKATGENYEVEFRCKRASDGAYRWFLARGVPVVNPRGQIVRWIGTSTDIHALKEAEAQIGLLNARLHRAVYESSHRIKNQLQVLCAIADMALLDGHTLVPAQEVHRLRSQIAAIAATHDILTQETRADGTTDHISLNSLLERTLTALQQTTDRHLLRFTLDSAVVPVKAATSIALLLNEMVSNAIKHGGGIIEVTLVVADGQGRLVVCDDGPGFPDGFVARRAANTGLELVLTLAQTDLGGTVEFTNRGEGGAKVTVIFPLSAPN